MTYQHKNRKKIINIPVFFAGIPVSICWAIVTVTTVGYGDMVPITVAGKVLTSVISLLGLAVFAMPAAILAAGFFEEMGK